MSTYCAVADVRTGTGFNNNANITDGTIEQYIEMTVSIINAIIGSTYQLPIDVDVTPCALLTNIAIQMSTALLYMNEYGEDSQDNTGKSWKDRYALAEKIANDVKLLKKRLFDDDTYLELPRNDTRLPTFFPTAASSDPNAPCTTAPQITMDQIY